MNRIKTVNTIIWGTWAIIDWGRWFLVGKPDTPEIIFAKQNKEQMERIEKKLDKILAIEVGLPNISSVSSLSDEVNPFILIDP